jgi:hypothetical protein
MYKVGMAKKVKNTKVKDYSTGVVLGRQHTRRFTRHQAVFDAKSCRVLSEHSRLV